MPVKEFRWYARLVYDQFGHDQTLLSFLATCLKDPSFTILEKECRHYLVSSEFESLVDEFDVSKYANKYLYILNSLIKLKFVIQPPAYHRIKVDGIYRPNKEGRLVKADSFFHTVDFEPTKKFLKTANEQHPSILELWTAVKNHPELEEVLNYYDYRYDWINLYKIYEVIKKDVVKLEKTGVLSRGTLVKWTKGRARDFEQSAHNAYISGKDARHSYAGSHMVQGINPMSLSEASEIITYLLQEWLKIKV